MTTSIETQWSERVRRYSQRNRDRLINMELIQNDLSAIPEVRRLRLAGLDYDEQARRVDIMLRAGADQLCHPISNVQSVYMLIPADGDDVLMVEHKGGRTILTAMKHS